MLSDGLDACSSRQRRRHVPRQQFVNAVDRFLSNALEHIGEIRLRIEAVQARRADKAIYRGDTFAAGVGADEQVIPSGEGDAAQRSLGYQVINRRAPVAAVVEERRPPTQCSGLMNPDTDLCENGRHEEVSDEQATMYVFPGV